MRGFNFEIRAETEKTEREKMCLRAGVKKRDFETLNLTVMKKVTHQS